MRRYWQPKSRRSVDLFVKMGDRGGTSAPRIRGFCANRGVAGSSQSWRDHPARCSPERRTPWAVSVRAAFAPLPAEAEPLAGDGLIALRRKIDRVVVHDSGLRPWPPVSDQLLGRTHVMQGLVTINVFMVESDAANPENTFDWDASEVTLATSEIQEALYFWSFFAGIVGRNLTFDLRLHTPDLYECQVPGEPSLHDGGDPGYWMETVAVTSVMQRMGFTGGVIGASRPLQRVDHRSNDRAFSAYLVDGNNYFANGSSRTHRNGPFLVSLRRPASGEQTS
jgi:hypothetical protein